MGKIINLFDRYGGFVAMNIFDVAKVFLTFESMTHKKLQKLCYYAQSWHLALHKTKLFDSRFEAWIHGPVCPELYQKYKAFGWNTIPNENINMQTMDKEKVNFINDVYAAYGHLSGDDLEYISHNEEPWLKARDGIDSMTPCDNLIDENIMKDFYWGIYEKSQGD